ncbi:hypothetical protein D3C81_2242050 [compost metagenome]
MKQLAGVQFRQRAGTGGAVIRAAHRYQPLIEQSEAVDLGGKTPIGQQDRGLKGFAVEVDTVDIHPDAR